MWECVNALVCWGLPLRGGYIPLALGQKSGKSCKSLSFRGFCLGAGSVQIWVIFINLVDLHKVSLALLAMVCFFGWRGLVARESRHTLGLLGWGEWAELG